MSDNFIQIEKEEKETPVESPKTAPKKDINDLNVVDFLRACTGVNEDNEPNSTIALSLSEYYGGDPIDLNFNDMGNRISTGGVISFTQQEDFVILDITYVSHIAPELRMLWDSLEKYGRLTGEGENILAVFTIMPKKYFPDFYLCLANPIYWTRIPSVFGSDKPNMLRILIKAENVYINASDGNVDVTKLKAEAERTYITKRNEKRS